MENQTKQRTAITIPALVFDHDLRLDLVPAIHEGSDLLQLHVRVQDADTGATLLTISIDDLLKNTLKTIEIEAGSLYSAALLMVASELDRISEGLKKSAGTLPVEFTRTGHA